MAAFALLPLEEIASWEFAERLTTRPAYWPQLPMGPLRVNQAMVSYWMALESDWQPTDPEREQMRLALGVLHRILHQNERMTYATFGDSEIRVLREHEYVLIHALELFEDVYECLATVQERQRQMGLTPVVASRGSLAQHASREIAGVAPLPEETPSLPATTPNVVVMPGVRLDFGLVHNDEHLDIQIPVGVEVAPPDEEGDDGDSWRYDARVGAPDPARLAHYLRLEEVYVRVGEDSAVDGGLFEDRDEALRAEFYEREPLPEPPPEGSSLGSDRARERVRRDPGGWAPDSVNAEEEPFRRGRFDDDLPGESSWSHAYHPGPDHEERDRHRHWVGRPPAPSSMVTPGVPVSNTALPGPEGLERSVLRMDVFGDETPHRLRAAPKPDPFGMWELTSSLANALSGARASFDQAMAQATQESRDDLEPLRKLETLSGLSAVLTHIAQSVHNLQQIASSTIAHYEDPPWQEPRVGELDRRPDAVLQLRARGARLLAGSAAGVPPDAARHSHWIREIQRRIGGDSCGALSSNQLGFYARPSSLEPEELGDLLFAEKGALSRSLGPSLSESLAVSAQLRAGEAFQFYPVSGYRWGDPTVVHQPMLACCTNYADLRRLLLAPLLARRLWNEVVPRVPAGECPARLLRHRPRGLTLWVREVAPDSYYEGKACYETRADLSRGGYAWLDPGEVLFELSYSVDGRRVATGMTVRESLAEGAPNPIEEGGRWCVWVMHDETRAWRE